LQRALNLSDIAFGHDSTSQRLVDGDREKIRRKMVRCAVGQRPWHGRDGDHSDPRPLRPADVRIVERDAIRDSKAAISPGYRYREMGSRGEHVGEVVQHESGFMREDAGLLGPEPDGNEILLLARGEVLEAIDASPDAEDLPAAQVLDEQLRGVPRLFRLLCREVALLAKSDAVEAVPVRPAGVGAAHTPTLTAGLYLCKQTNMNQQFGFLCSLAAEPPNPSTSIADFLVGAARFEAVTPAV
jgi:hypothetical protein